MSPVSPVFHNVEFLNKLTIHGVIRPYTVNIKHNYRPPDATHTIKNIILTKFGNLNTYEGT